MYSIPEKETDRSPPHHLSIDTYCAIIDGGVRNTAQLEEWLT